MGLTIWHISDTHGFHGLLDLPYPSEVDMVIFSGDCSNAFESARNSVEVKDFMAWFEILPYEYKIWIAGNHDTSIERGLVRPNEELKTCIYLKDSLLNIDGINIYGSPWTPTYGNWVFMKQRGKLGPIWEQIPEGIDILITHGPPKGVLDLTETPDRDIMQAGCRELWNRVIKVKPTYNLFGHIHNCHGVVNQGIVKFSAFPTTFSNGSVVEDGKFGKLTSNGNIIKL